MIGFQNELGVYRFPLEYPNNVKNDLFGKYSKAVIGGVDDDATGYDATAKMVWALVQTYDGLKQPTKNYNALGLSEF